MSEAKGVTVRMGSARPAQCRSCGVDVTFYRTKADKWMPFTGNPTPETQPELLSGEAIFGTLPASANHFMTCPDATIWRKR